MAGVSPKDALPTRLFDALPHPALHRAP
jgi:hypothetical protein